MRSWNDGRYPFQAVLGVLTRDWLDQATRRLSDVGVPEPRLDSQVLLAHAMGRDRSWLLAHPEMPVPASVEGLLLRRERREPLAYIVQSREFYGRSFAVGPGVLVPRQESEVLIDLTLGLLSKGARLLDVGTGSGCLAVTLKLESPECDVSACDLSIVALDMARVNAERLGANVSFTHSDLFAAYAGMKFDVLLSNPPYVGDSDELPPEVRYFEPAQALFAGKDGLDIYRKIADTAREHLEPRGFVVLEIGDGMGVAVKRVFSSWCCHATATDLSGRERALVFSAD